MSILGCWAQSKQLRLTKSLEGGREVALLLEMLKSETITKGRMREKSVMQHKGSLC